MRQSRRKEPPKVWHPPTYDIDDIRAVQALFTGTASEGMQKRALDWIINKAAATYDNGFVPDDPHGRIAAFVDGRQFVGQQIVKLLKLKPELFRADREDQ